MIFEKDISSFLQLSENFHIIDVRSPFEYNHGHIPKAHSLPLLNDDERKQVGICYKESGKLEAVSLGYKLVGSKFSSFIEFIRKISSYPLPITSSTDYRLPPQPITSPLPKILIHCWRGGMRSRIMAEIMSHAGFEVFLLIGGYKSFRNWVLDVLKQRKLVNVLGGYTGSGKTEMLVHLKNTGHQVIDLEKLACHKGSAFGGLGSDAQPTNEQFENELAIEWNNIDPEKPLWLEDESRNIGKIKIPDPVYNQMRENNLYILQKSREERINRILNEYGKFPKEILAEKTVKIQKKLGLEQTHKAISYLNEGDLNGWVNILLDYYDKLYEIGMSKRIPEFIQKFHLK